MVKRYLPIGYLLSVLLGLCASPVLSQAHERNDVLRKCSDSFQRIADEEKLLFEVNRFYVLRVKFDENGTLSELAVEPKFYFADERSEWKETESFTALTGPEFDKLKRTIMSLKDTGKLIKEANKIAFVTNMTAWYTEVYENGKFTWGVVTDLRKGDDPPFEVKWFRMRFKDEED